MRINNGKRRKCMERLIIINDDKVFVGESFGSEENTEGTVFIDTNVSSYLSNFNREGIAIHTYPEIGTVGISGQNTDEKTQLKAMIISELSECPSHFESHNTLNEYCSKAGIVGVKGIDTRELVRYLHANNIESVKIVSKELS